MTDDALLLQGYAGERSETAFRALVERHLPMVLATARRLVGGDAHLAQDVAQAVFTDLARKAATLPGTVVLGGWLHRHTCFLAAKAVRSERRRRAREKTALEMQTLHEIPARDEAWQQLAPVLDAALDNLSADDRDAIVLRYLQQQDLRGVGDRLGVSQDAAQKRVARALEKLRALLVRRGVTFPAALLAATLETGAMEPPVSAGLAAAISSSALSRAAAGSMLTSLTTMLTSKPMLGAAAAIALGALVLIFVLRHTAPAPSASSAAPRAETLPLPAPSPQLPTGIANAGAAPIAGSPASGAASPGGTAVIGPLSSTDLAGGTVLIPATAAAAPASVAPDSGAGNDPNRPVRALTVRNGELSMTTTYADGSVSTEPYTEYGATATITPGSTPETHVVTFWSDSDGKIVARIIGVPEAPPDRPAGAFPPGDANGG